MKFLNLGCGTRYNTEPVWVNVDIYSTGPDVIAHDLRKGVPYPDKSFDLVYHSHILEHIPRDKTGFFLDECFRVLKPGGVLRVVIPDLEQITQSYLALLEEGVKHPDSILIAEDYDWMMLEMYDQVVRKKSGGGMLDYLKNPRLSNTDFLIRRCGYEVRNILDSLKKQSPEPAFSGQASSPSVFKRIYRLIRYKNYRDEQLARWLLGEEFEQLQETRFRNGGEVHQWMYDRYSLTRLLKKYQFEKMAVRSASESFVSEWSRYNLDTQPDGSVYKPDSLFMEAVRPI